MKSRKSARTLEVAQRRELQIAAAVAREKAMQFHVSSALRLIALAADRISPLRMLEIHVRLHWVVGAEAELLANRVLAALGESAPADAARLFVAGQIEPEADTTSIWRSVRSRLRGRVHHDLRRWIELAVGAAQAGLVHIHVQHAVRFAQELAETHTVAEAGALYIEMVGMPTPLQQAFHLTLLNRLAGEELPRISAGGPAAPAAAPAQPQPAQPAEAKAQVNRFGRRQAV